MSQRTSESIAALEDRMGHRPGPADVRRPGDSHGTALLVGHLPTVTTYRVHTGRRAALDEVVGRFWLFVVFVMWVMVPMLTMLGLLLQ